MIVAVTSTGVTALPPALRPQVCALGASDAQYLWLVARARLPLPVAVMAGFGALVPEVLMPIILTALLAGSSISMYWGQTREEDESGPALHRWSCRE